MLSINIFLPSITETFSPYFNTSNVINQQIEEADLTYAKSLFQYIKCYQSTRYKFSAGDTIRLFQYIKCYQSTPIPFLP